MRQYFFKKGGTIPVTARKRKRGDDYNVLSKFSNYIFRHTVNNTIAARFSERSEQNKKAPTKDSPRAGGFSRRGSAAEINSFAAKSMKRRSTMSKNNIVVPQAKDALERFKMEAASDVGFQSHLEKLKSQILCGF